MRYERPNGVVQHYEGEKGTERLVRQLERPAPPVPSGDVLHYEGEKGVRVERLVRREQPSGVVLQTARARGTRSDWCARSVYPVPFDISMSFHGERGRERPNVTFVNLFVLAIVRFIVYVCRLQLVCQ